MNWIREPHKVRLSENFLLSDFMGCHSVYTHGLSNRFPAPGETGYEARICNGEALARSILEPLLAQFGPMSISYGYISPGVSNSIVKYQDPSIPSYHRWDLGAAADILLHDVLYPYENGVKTSPVYLAHHFFRSLDLPLNRCITYSESPYICVAANALDIADECPKEVFYEYRYPGAPGVKPEYIKMMTATQRDRRYRELMECDHFDWIGSGAGRPSYHLGGKRQMQHVRTSRYTMLTDWLYDCRSISGFEPNCVDWDCASARTRRAFVAAGAVYDKLLHVLKKDRLSIIQGYMAPDNPFTTDTDPDHDWSSDRLEIGFTADFDASHGNDPLWVADGTNPALPGVRFVYDRKMGGVHFVFSVDEILESPEYEKVVDFPTDKTDKVVRRRRR